MKLKVEETETAPLLLRVEMRCLLFAGWFVFLMQSLLTCLLLTFIPEQIRKCLDLAAQVCFTLAEHLHKGSDYFSVLRKFGLTYSRNESRRSSYYKFRWGSLTLTVPRCEFSAKVHRQCRESGREYASSVCLYFLGQALFIYLPPWADYDSAKHDPKNEHHGESRDFGFYTFEGRWIFHTFVLCWGWKRLHFYMPWTWENVRMEVLKQDMKTVVFTSPSSSWLRSRLPSFVSKRLSKRPGFLDTYDERKRLETEHSAEYSYAARHEQGVQTPVLATYHVQRYVWRLRGLPFVRKSDLSIDVNFAEPVGSPSKVASWKGGTVGCSYAIKKGETPAECIKRMEVEYVFR